MGTLPGKLTGFGKVVAAAVAGAIVLQDTSEANDDVIALASDIINDDCVLLFQKSVNGATAPTSVLPAGFTLVGTANLNAAGTSTRFHISFKKGVNGDAGANKSGMSGGTGRDAKLCMVFRHPDGFASITKKDFDGQVTNSNPGNQTATAGGGTVPIIVFGFYSELDNTNPSSRSMSPAEDGEQDTSFTDDIFIKFKIYNAGDTPANGTISMNDEGAKNCLGSFYLELVLN